MTQRTALLGPMLSIEDARARFLTEGTEEARWVYRAAVGESQEDAHAQVEEMYGPNAQECGEWTSAPPCGGCVRCMHMQVSYSFSEYRKEAWIS